MIINIADIPITGILSNFGYLIFEIISMEITMLKINAIYGLNKPLK